MSAEEIMWTAAGYLTIIVVAALVIGRILRRPDCRCGHPQAAHEHYRPGADCAIPSCDCPRYTPPHRPKPPPPGDGATDTAGPPRPAARPPAAGKGPAGTGHWPPASPSPLGPSTGSDLDHGPVIRRIEVHADSAVYEWNAFTHQRTLVYAPSHAFDVADWERRLRS